MYDTAHDIDELLELINDSGSCPTIAREEAERIRELALQRATVRGEDSCLDGDVEECLITTDWEGFASGEFGYDNGEVNQFAMGEHNARVSKNAGASLFENTVVIQNSWLLTGVSRGSKTKDYNDAEFDGADEGEFWIPKSAQDYILIVILAPEFVHGSPDFADAM